ncbi:MAG: hypothetical protein AAB423_02450 [Patescibacteria group bacterium]
MKAEVIEQALILSNNYRRVTDQILRERLGITYAKFLILVQINEGHNTSNIISKNLGKTEASISRQIAMLEKELIIKRKNNRTDDRVKVIALTKKGALVLKNCNKVIDGYFNNKISKINKKDEIIKTLKTINKDMTKL